MSKWLNRFGPILLGGLLLLLMLLSFFNLRQLPVEILSAVGIKEHDLIERARIQTADTYRLLWATWGTALVLFFFLFKALLTRREQEIVYVPKYASHTIESEQKEQTRLDAETALQAVRKELQLHRHEDAQRYGDRILTPIARELEAVAGAYYQLRANKMTLVASYAYVLPEGEPMHIQEGDGVMGEVLQNKQPLLLTDVPGENLRVYSGLGASKPRQVLMHPILNAENEKVLAILELALLSVPNEEQKLFLKNASAIIAEELTTKGGLLPEAPATT